MYRLISPIMPSIPSFYAGQDSLLFLFYKLYQFPNIENSEYYCNYYADKKMDQTLQIPADAKFGDTKTGYENQHQKCERRKNVIHQLLVNGHMENIF